MIGLRHAASISIPNDFVEESHEALLGRIAPEMLEPLATITAVAYELRIYLLRDLSSYAVREGRRTLIFSGGRAPDNYLRALVWTSVQAAQSVEDEMPAPERCPHGRSIASRAANPCPPGLEGCELPHPGDFDGVAASPSDLGLPGELDEPR